MATQFVRVRIARIDSSDLNLFQFDLDTTFAVFFMNADGEIYGRYGGRDSTDDDSRMSLDGLRYAMEAAVKTHAQKARDRQLVKPWKTTPLFINSVRSNRRRRGCMHCHNAKEVLLANQQWSRELAYRYPPPDNLGLTFEIDRGDIVKNVLKSSAAEKAGLKTGDRVTALNQLPVHSFADAQYALDGAPQTGTIPIRWNRDGKSLSGTLALARGWRKTDIQWRPSMMEYLASARLYGEDLTGSERKRYGLKSKQLAFWQRQNVHSQAQAAGIKARDIILGFDGKSPDITAYEFQRYVRRNFVSGDRVKVDLIRNGKRMSLPMKLR